MIDIEKKVDEVAAIELCRHPTLDDYEKFLRAFAAEVLRDGRDAIGNDSRHAFIKEDAQRIIERLATDYERGDRG